MDVNFMEVDKFGSSGRDLNGLELNENNEQVVMFANTGALGISQNMFLCNYCGNSYRNAESRKRGKASNRTQRNYRRSCREAFSWRLVFKGENVVFSSCFLAEVYCRGIGRPCSVTGHVGSSAM